MARKKAEIKALDEQWIARTEGVDPIAGVPGPGRWIIFEYQPTALFSLKMSRATSSVGRTLVVPTPYAVKMAFVDAAFRTGWNGDVNELIQSLAHVELRLGVPERATVTHTIVKIRQEPKDAKSGVPYIPAVAYREFVHFQGLLSWAFDLGQAGASISAALVEIAPMINYVGKRGGFIQYVGARRTSDLGTTFTQALGTAAINAVDGIHIATLDDFGPEANLDALNSFSETSLRRDKQRMFRETLVPLGLINVGPGFTEYARADSN